MSDDVDVLLASYKVSRRLTVVVLLSLVCIFSLLALFHDGAVTEKLSLRLGVRQDLPLAWFFLLLAFLRPTVIAHRTLPDFKTTVPALLLSLLTLFLVGWMGNQWVFHGYLLSRDEQVAVFDQEIFAHGRLFWPIPVDWRPFVDAFNRLFLLPIGANEFWVSGYLPIHSAFRALMETIGIADLSSPIMAALSGLGLWIVALRLWPDSNRTVILALLLLVTSSQILVTSMTAFSMSMHLALNLIWLALFLADRRQTHILALVLGLFATGIHQPLFHPLFVLPFLVLLMQQGRWRLLSFYIVGYAAIGFFWLAWPVWIASHGTSPATAIRCGSTVCTLDVSFFDRLLAAVSPFDLEHLWMTAANVLRFICWQHPLLVPLALFGAISSWHSEPLVRALAIGFALPIIVMAIILPWQGVGWGYRYVHPVLGNAILLACYGFRRMETGGLSMQRPLVITTAAAIVLVPLHAWMVAQFAAPFIAVHKDILAMPGDVVIVDTELVPFAPSFVLNRFDLANQPKLMIAAFVEPEDLSALCKRSTISFYDRHRMDAISHLFETPVPQGPSVKANTLKVVARKAGCRIAERAGTNPQL